MTLTISSSGAAFLTNIERTKVYSKNPEKKYLILTPKQTEEAVERFRKSLVVSQAA